MNLYLLAQQNGDYDTYDFAIVCAENVEEAVKIHPNGDYFDTGWTDVESWAASPEYVQCRKIGAADEFVGKGSVLASFNAG